MQERVDDLEALDRTDLALAFSVRDFIVKALSLTLQVESFQALANSFSTHVGGEEHSVAVLDVLEDSVLGAQVAHGERAEVVPHALQMSDVVVEVLANRGELFLPGVVGLALLISFSVGRF